MAETITPQQRHPINTPTVVSADAQSADNFRLTWSRLANLLYLEEDEDYTRPTQYAYEAAFELLLSLREEMQRHRLPFPRASFSTTDKGSVLAFWRHPERSVQLVVPYAPGDHGYIHVLSGPRASTQEELTGAALAQALSAPEHQTASNG